MQAGRWQSTAGGVEEHLWVDTHVPVGSDVRPCDDALGHVRIHLEVFFNTTRCALPVPRLHPKQPFELTLKASLGRAAAASASSTRSSVASRRSL